MSTEVAIQHPSSIPYSTLERMAVSISKSGMFACKTPEGAMSLLLIAQAEGVHPAQAMMDYDLIQGKPALKTAAMLARFQRSGGKVKWLQSTDDVASAEFSHPAGGKLVVTWDRARLVTAGLADKDMHKKFPAQMKRARCIGEGVRAVAPQCIPAGMYAVEEVQDMEPVDVTPASRVEATVETAAAMHTALTSAERDEHMQALMGADSTESLARAFAASWTHAKQAKDTSAADAFKNVYDIRKQELTPVATEVQP